MIFYNVIISKPVQTDTGCSFLSPVSLTTAKNRSPVSMAPATIDHQCRRRSGHLWSNNDARDRLFWRCQQCLICQLSSNFCSLSGLPCSLFSCFCSLDSLVFSPFSLSCNSCSLSGLPCSLFSCFFSLDNLVFSPFTLSCMHTVGSAGIFKQSMGAWNWLGKGLPNRPARLHSLAESFPWDWFLGSLKV